MPVVEMMISRNQYPNFTLSIASFLSLLLLMSPLSLFSQDSSPPSPDFDGNGTVDIPDFLLFTDVFGSKEGEEKYDAKYDLDGNGEIGISDFLLFMDSFGKTVNSDNEESTLDDSSGGSGGNGGGTSPPPPPLPQHEIPQVTISAGTTPVTEGTDVTFTITTTPPSATLVLSGCIIDETGNVMSDEEAQIGPSTIINYATLETIVPVTIKTIDDDVDEPDSVVTVTVQWEEKKTGRKVGNPFSASVTVEDNDPP